MKLFFDTSTLVKRYIDETGSDLVSELFENSSQIFISQITKIEFQSVLIRLLNTKILSQENYELAKSEFLEDYKDFEIIKFDFELETLAFDLIQIYGLRSLDGIQLASAIKCNAEKFLTSDKKLFEASKKELKFKSELI